MLGVALAAPHLLRNVVCVVPRLQFSAFVNFAAFSSKQHNEIFSKCAQERSCQGGSKPRTEEPPLLPQLAPLAASRPYSTPPPLPCCCRRSRCRSRGWPLLWPLRQLSAQVRYPMPQRPLPLHSEF